MLIQIYVAFVFLLLHKKINMQIGAYKMHVINFLKFGNSQMALALPHTCTTNAFNPIFRCMCVCVCVCVCVCELREYCNGLVVLGEHTPHEVNIFVVLFPQPNS